MSIIDDAGKQDDAKGGDWTAGLSPEQLQTVQTKGYKSPADVITAYMNAERLVGADKIPVPKDGVWDEVARVKLGIPSDVKGYKVERPQLPEGLPYDEKFEESALAVAHEVGLTPKQAQRLVEFYAKTQGDAFTNLQQQTESDRQATVAELTKEFGKAYDDQVAHAARAARHFGGDALIEYLNGSGAGNNPHLIRAFAKIGQALREDKMPGGGPSSGALTPEQARVEANKLMASEAYRKREHPEHADVVRRVQQLFESAYPSG